MARQHPDLDQIYKIIDQNKLYAGFGFARDLIDHIYNGSNFSPRDYDFAVVGSTWTESEAEAKLSKLGSVVRKIDMWEERLAPNGNIFSYHYGFVIIIEYEGLQLDFKFFKTLEDAHKRGFYNTEKILIPLRGLSIAELVNHLQLKTLRGLKLPVSQTLSDPYGGVQSIIEKKPVTVNWPKAKALTLDWIIRGAMINAKLGRDQFSKEEKLAIAKIFPKIKYVLPSGHALIQRASQHPRSDLVFALLESVGFFNTLPKWRWSELSNSIISEWSSKISNKTFKCSAML